MLLRRNVKKIRLRWPQGGTGFAMHGIHNKAYRHFVIGKQDMAGRWRRHACKRNYWKPACENEFSGPYKIDSLALPNKIHLYQQKQNSALQQGPQIVLMDSSEGKILFKPLGYHKLLLAVSVLCSTAGKVLTLQGLLSVAFWCAMDTGKKTPKNRRPAIKLFNARRLYSANHRHRNEIIADTIRQRMVKQFGDDYVEKDFLFFPRIIASAHSGGSYLWSYAPFGFWKEN